MDVRVAKSAGFCFGVKLAVDRTEELIKKYGGEHIYTIGKLIHNPTIVRDMQDRGVRVIGDDEQCEREIRKIAENASEDNPIRVVIRAHGVKKSVSDLLTSLKNEREGFDYIDCTCPRVSKVHNIVGEKSAPDVLTLIMGDASHPEIIGIAGYARGDVLIFKTADELEKALENDSGLCSREMIVVAQTTFDIIEWKNSQKSIEKYCTKAIIFDTICNVTEIRQTEAFELSKNVDLMLVIGGRESSNTNKLYNIAARGMLSRSGDDSDSSRYTFLVESKDELPLELFTRNITVGITAGASTPSGIIEEVLKTMADIVKTSEPEFSAEDFAGMLEESLKTLNTGDTVKGTIMSITPNEIHVDLGAKVTGIIPYSEITDTGVSLEETYKVGDEIEAILVRYSDLDGVATLSRRRIESIINWKKVVEAYNEGAILEGKYLDVVKGGIIMQIDANRVFVPASHTGLPKDADLATLSGTTARVKIIEINEQRRRAVASARNVLREERKAKEAEFWANIAEGQEFDGVVKSLTSYGAFVDLGGVDGMVHSSELSWKRIHHPSEVVKVGETIHVFVKSFDAESRRISLGYKTEESNPWNIFTAQYNVGDVVNVKVVSMMPFGAFAEIVPGADGLIHISQLANHKVAKPQDVLEIGQMVDVKITNIDNDTHQISLSIRALLEETEEAAEEIVEEAAEEVQE